ncbi:MAG TPA: prepilin-type N-terminal cleavage/methylation domain-containing protein [Methylomirabilota bacterium]|nr:prepilin-type N-terminal cleavage/methylation domain-containing protein [Methylomirabilota bacterium]
MEASARRSRQGGFTLIELLIVVAVIGIIVAVAIPNLIGAIQRSRQSRTMADLRMISEGVELYQNDHSFYPLLDSGTVADLGDHLRLYIRDYNELDGWSTPIDYHSDGHGYTLVSYGWDAVVDLPWTFGATDSFDADIVFTNGNFLQWPEGPQQF